MLQNQFSTLEVLQTIYNQSMEISKKWLEQNYSSEFMEDIKNPLTIQKQLNMLGCFGQTQVYQMQKISHWIAWTPSISNLSDSWEKFIIKEKKTVANENKDIQMDFGLSNFFETLNINF
jgi:hypothetical protein